MIVTECAVFFTMFTAGAAATGLATCLLALGRASNAARAVFDFLTPLVVGAAFFFALQLSSSGVFRLYAAVAFCLGEAAFYVLFKKASPYIKRLLLKAAVPIQSLENKVDKIVLPLAERVKNKKRLFDEKRLEHCRIRKEKAAEKRQSRALLRAQNKQKGKAKAKLLAYKREMQKRAHAASLRQIH